MKKNILFSLLIVLISFLAYQAYIFYGAPANNLKSIYLVPKNAVLIVETQEPIDNWSEISQSDIWKHLQKNDYFKQLTQSLNGFDNTFSEQKKLIDFIGNREMIISIHVTQKKKYDLLYIADLQKMAKLNLLKEHLSSFVGKEYKLTKRKYHNHEILELYNKKSRETLCISFIENQMIASFTHLLVEQAISQHLEPVIGRDLQYIDISKKVGNDNMFRLYVHYKYMNSYLECFLNSTDSMVKNINKTFNYSGFSFDLKSNTIIADGFTNTNNNASIYLQALQKSGKGKRSIAQIAPKRTGLYMSFSFYSFTKFYANFESVQKEDPTQFKAYQESLSQIENYLDIDIKTNFISWIDNEIALLQMQASKGSTRNDIALVFKIKDREDAEKNLAFILKKIKKKTPVKFKTINYKDYQIQFMSIKGFFKVLLGDMFNKFDKPYFSIIDDYIVFSNHPNTLKNIIDDYKANETLNESEDYQDFNTNFESKSNMFTYFNTPILYKNIYGMADNATRKQLTENKDFIICFPQIGFQLTSFGDLFESKLIVSYQDPAIVKNKEQFKDKIIGPRIDEDQQTDQSIENTNLLEIETINLFKISEINPTDLDAKDYIVKYKNGKIHFEVELENGLLDGKYREYYENGELKLKGYYKNSEQARTWKAYDINGKLIEKKRF